MAMIANDPKKAKQLGVPQSVGKDFTEADKGKKFGGSSSGRVDLQKANVKKTDHGQSQLFKEGGKVMKSVDMKKNPGVAKLPTAVRNKMGFMKKGGMAKDDKSQDKSMVKKAVGMHDKQQHGGKKTNLANLRKGGMACSPKKYEEGGEIEFETKVGPNKNISDDIRERAMKAAAEGGQKEAPKAKPRMKAKPKSNAMTDSMSRMNAMGDTYKKGGSVRGCGIAKKGLTIGKIV